MPRLQILPQVDDLGADGSQIVHRRQELLFLLSKAQHQARFGEFVRIDLFHHAQEAEGAVVVGARPDPWGQATHGFQIVAHYLRIPDHHFLEA